MPPYDALTISADGNNLVVRAKRWNNSSMSSYIRQIPLANVDLFDNLYYSSSNSSDMGYAVSKTDNSVFVSGYWGNNYGSLLKLYVDGGVVKQDMLYSDSGFSLTTGQPDPEYPTGLFYYSYNSSTHTYDYEWSNFWKTNGNLDAERVLSYINSAFVEPITFTYNGKTNEDAILEIDPAIGANGSSAFFAYCSNESGSPAKTFEAFKAENSIRSLSFSNFRQLFHLADNSLWGINDEQQNPKKIVKLLDTAGKKSLAVPAAFRGNTYNPIRFVSSGTKFIFSDAKYSGSSETGFQGLYLIDVSTPDMAPVNLLENVPNKDRLEMYDFSVAGNIMYFSAGSGSSILCGKIDIDTKAYSPVSFGQKITNLIVF